MGINLLIIEMDVSSILGNYIAATGVLLTVLAGLLFSSVLCFAVTSYRQSWCYFGSFSSVFLFVCFMNCDLILSSVL